MGKVYNLDSVGKDRIRLSKTIVLALRELMKQTEINATTKDLTAYIILSLEEIANNIDISVGAWEKRGYWVKADKFRLEWEWAGAVAKQMRRALITDDWGGVALAAAKIAQKLNKVTVPERNRLGTPWVGAGKLVTPK